MNRSPRARTSLEDMARVKVGLDGLSFEMARCSGDGVGRDLVGDIDCEMRLDEMQLSQAGAVQPGARSTGAPKHHTQRRIKSALPKCNTTTTTTLPRERCRRGPRKASIVNSSAQTWPENCNCSSSHPILESSPLSSSSSFGSRSIAPKQDRQDLQDTRAPPDRSPQN